MATTFTEKASKIEILPLNETTVYISEMTILEEDAFYHTHEECEIYINLEGDVSFMVESTIYPIQPGSVIITRPFEFHHVIYHSNALHRCVILSFLSNGNEEILDFLFDRPHSTNNLIQLSSENLSTLLDLCTHIQREDRTPVARQIDFLRMLSIFQEGSYVEFDISAQRYPDVRIAVEYINRHLNANFTIRQLAEISHVSVNSLERHFSKVLNMSPYFYMTKKRLSKAAEFLQQGESVTYAALESGFADYSHFIALFKRHYHKTPLQYQKANAKKRRSSERGGTQKFAEKAAPEAARETDNSPPPEKI